MNPISLTKTSGDRCSIYSSGIFALMKSRYNSTVVMSVGGAEVHVLESMEEIEAAIEGASPAQSEEPLP